MARCSTTPTATAADQEARPSNEERALERRSAQALHGTWNAGAPAALAKVGRILHRCRRRQQCGLRFEIGDGAGQAARAVQASQATGLAPRFGPQGSPCAVVGTARCPPRGGFRSLGSVVDATAAAAGASGNSRLLRHHLFGRLLRRASRWPQRVSARCWRFSSVRCSGSACPWRG